MEASTLTHASRSGLLARRSPLLRLQGDDKLVSLIREHHDRAFEVLFDRFQSRLLAFCRGMLSSSEDAEDVLQEVFVNAHAAMLADSRPINVRPWLYRIARNRCLNHLRKPVPEGQDSMDIHQSGGSGTLEKVQRREELRAIFADVGELPETQRTALVLREIDDLSYDEIAEAMGTTLPAVKSLLVRARMSLAEASESRVLDCNDVRLVLAEAAEGLTKLDGATRHHVRKCDGCGRYRSELRSSTKALAALSPVFPLLALKALIAGKLFGGSSSASSAGGASAGGAGGTGVGAGAGATGAGATGAGAGSAGLGAGAAGGAAAGTSGAAMGGGAAASGLAGSGITGGGLAGGALTAVGAKAATGFATAALITAGAVGVQHMTSKTDPKGATTASATPARASDYHRAATVQHAAAIRASGGTASQSAPSAAPDTAKTPPSSTDPKPTGDAPPPADTPPTGSSSGDPGATTPPPHGVTGGAVDGSGGDPDASGQSGDPPPTYGGPTTDPPPVVTPPSPEPPPVVIPPDPPPPTPAPPPDPPPPTQGPPTNFPPANG